MRFVVCSSCGYYFISCQFFHCRPEEGCVKFFFVRILQIAYLSFSGKLFFVTGN